MPTARNDDDSPAHNYFNDGHLNDNYYDDGHTNNVRLNDHQPADHNDDPA